MADDIGPMSPLNDSSSDFEGLPDGELAELTARERNTLNDEAAHDPEFISLRGPFLDWVAEQLAIVEVVGSKDRVRWCDRWYDHPEAVARLYALWGAKVQADQDENDLGAASSWWTNHWDRHAPILFDPQTGPFRDCDQTRGHLADRRKPDDPVVPLHIPPAEWRLPY